MRMVSRNRNKDKTDWLSLSDVMTGLMVIFMFIAISYINEKEQKVKEFKARKQLLLEELETSINDFEKDIELDQDLSIKFKNPDVLFDPGRSIINQEFDLILDKFIPVYLDILTKEKYKELISEVRIEGHTDTTAFYKARYPDDSYISNVLLSQERSTAVLYKIRSTEYYNSLSPEKKMRLRFWMTANGLSYGRVLNAEGDYSFKSSNKQVDNNLSRRVEFRIITTTDSLFNLQSNMVLK